MTKSAYEKLRVHLFPGDKLEAVAFALCGSIETEFEQVFTVHAVHVYPNEKCTVRKGDRVEWSPAQVVHLLDICRKKGLHLLKVHSHPEHWPFFSEVDDHSDLQLSDTLTGWVGRNDNFCSVVMLPDGSMIGRVIEESGNMIFLHSITVIGDDILIYIDHDLTNKQRSNGIDAEVQLRTRQAFGEGTTEKLKALKIGVVGCSGTGSIVAELLHRLGVGELVLVDHDKVEDKNVNRILNSTLDDARTKRYKVHVMKEAFEQTGISTRVTAIATTLHDEEAYQLIAACDMVFGCMDTVDGRHLLNRIATYFCSAYFDIGIRLDADGKGGINEILGRIDYIQPGGSSLLTRGRYTLEQLKAADMARTNPEEYSRQLKEGYIKSAKVQSPAVISINMLFSSHTVTELLARLHPFRDDNNARYAAVTYSVSGFLLLREKDGEPDAELLRKVGLGHKTPALDAPMLITTQKSVDA